jgi:hypothetical protein
MAFLDFIKNRNATAQQSVAQKAQYPKPETAKEMYIRQASQDRTAQQPMDRMPADQQAKVEAIKQRLEGATRHISPEGPQAPIPADNSGSREAMRQNMTAQDKTAAPLSPTSVQAGQTAEKGAPEPSGKTPEKTPARSPQTVPRRPPSWER